MKIRRITNHGQTKWVLDYYDGPKRVRRTFASKGEAEAASINIRAAIDAAPRLWLSMSDAERSDVMAVLLEIELKGLKLRKVWEDYQRRPDIVTNRKSLSEAIAELVRSRRDYGRRANYITGLEGFLNRFAAGREHTWIDEITLDEIQAWIGKQKSAWSKATVASRVATLFSYAQRRGWVKANPCERLEHVKMDARIPAILTSEQVRNGIYWTMTERPRFLAWLTLAVFAGIRPLEIDRLSWDAIDLAGGTVRIDPEGSKVRQRRVVHLKPNAVAWLLKAQQIGAELQIPHVSRRRFLRDLKAVFGLAKWEADILRHTCASYWLCSDNDAGRIALELGNSVPILMRHYLELVTKEESEKFWGISPG